MCHEPLVQQGTPYSLPLSRCCPGGLLKGIDNRTSGRLSETCSPISLLGCLVSKLFLGCEPWHLSVWFAVRWPTDLLCLGTLSLSGITIHQVTLMLPETKMRTQRWYPTHSPVFSLICLEDGAKPPFYIHLHLSCPLCCPGSPFLLPLLCNV